MPIQTLKLVPGTDTQETKALNEESGISRTNLIRFFPDRNGLALVQKLGGWEKFWPYQTVAPCRALWAWEDLNLNARLAIGTQTAPSSGSAQLAILTDGIVQDVTPTIAANSLAPVVSTTAGSASVLFTDTTITGVTSYNSVYIATQVAIGGLVLYGLYVCDPDGFLGAAAYTVYSYDQLGNLLPAPYTSSVPVLPTLSTQAGSITVTVNLPGYDYMVGDSFPILTPTQIGGVTFYGNYVVQSTPGLGGYLSPTFTNGSASIAGNNAFAAGQQISFVSVGGTLPTGLTAGTLYYVVSTGLTATHFEVSATPGGSPIVMGSAGTGTPEATYLSSTFTILTPIPATSTASGQLNYGNLSLLYSFGSGALPGGTGYGSGYYGQGGYGMGSPITPSTGTEIDAIDWTLDNFGEILIACPVRAAPANGIPFQPIYQWDEDAASATILTNAPPVNDGIFVAMPQRQIIAWGSTETGIQDPLLISWCDVGNFNVWIPNVTNQAGQFRIPKGSKIMAGVQGPQQGVIWTDIDVWSMQYIGQPDIYSFNEIGTGCGLISRKAAAAMNGIYYWMGPSQFYSLSSSGVQPIPCSVWDHIFQNLNQGSDPTTGESYLQRIRVAVNSRFGEISWFYPSATGSGEVDSYVKYNVGLGVWDYGTLGRSAWVDQSVLGPPIGSDPVSLYIYQHETSNDADGTAMLPSFETGFFAIAEGDIQTFVDLIMPDFKWGQYSQPSTATVQIAFNVTNYPGDTVRTYGPYSVTQATEYFYTRFRGRLVSIKISSSDLGSFWRIGALRYRGAGDGRF